MGETIKLIFEIITLVLISAAFLIIIAYVICAWLDDKKMDKFIKESIQSARIIDEKGETNEKDEADRRSN